MQYAVCVQEKYAVCSVCAGGVWRQLDDRQRQAAAHPPLPYLLAQLDCSTFPRKVFTRFLRHVINLTFGHCPVVSGRKARG